MKRIKEIQPLLVAIYTYNHINANNDIPKEKLRYWEEKYSKAKAILLQ